MLHGAMVSRAYMNKCHPAGSSIPPQPVYGGTRSSSSSSDFYHFPFFVSDIASTASSSAVDLGSLMVGSLGGGLIGAIMHRAQNRQLCARTNMEM